MRAVIMGAGIGGLAAAMALGQAGVPCEVVERRNAGEFGGGGIQISPNGVAVLRALGVEKALTDSFRPAARELRRWRDGELIGSIPLGQAAEDRYGAPYLTTSRRRLWEALFAEADGTFHFGRACVEVQEGPGGVEAVLDDGTRLAGDLLVGADGSNSVVRRSLKNDKRRYSGYAAYRAVVPRSGQETVTVWLGPGRHCVAYPISATEVNVVAVVAEPRPVALEHAEFTPAPLRQAKPAAASIDNGGLGLSVAGPRALGDAYGKWDPELREMLAAASGFDRYPLFERDPFWGQGRVKLIGDAAHPMLPFIAQGACQALEDAMALDNLPDRITRIERISKISRDGAVTYHLPDGEAQRDRDRHLAKGRLEDFDWLYGRERLEEHPRPSPDQAAGASQKT